MARLLITGANGQVGSDLHAALRRQDRAAYLVTLDVQSARPPLGGGAGSHTPHVTADVRDRGALERIVTEHDVDTVYHLASLLSVSGERAPDRAWSVNVEGLKNVLDLAREYDLKVFWPSSIAVFGPSTPKNPAPQTPPLDPRTMYGVTKVSGELLCQYYHEKYGVDVRSLRYPGLISHMAPPGGGTTDYAVEIFRAAAAGEPYTCFVRPGTRLPMMYMPDAARATLALMAADAERLTVRTSYNVAALSFTAEALADAIAARVPGFRCRFAPDTRQAIADSWPHAVDDAPARTDWDWQPAFGLEAIVEDMLEKLRETAASQPEGRTVGG